MFKSLSYDIEEVLKLFKQKRILDLRGLSSRLTREAAIETDYAKAELGVIAYALHKIETKQHFVDNPKWARVKAQISTVLEGALFAAENNNKSLLIKKLKQIINEIESIDSDLGNFAQNIYEKAKVKQASLAYSIGLSIAQASELTGADKKEVQSYIGFTKMPDEETEAKTISSRIQELKKLLEVKK